MTVDLALLNDVPGWVDEPEPVDGIRRWHASVIFDGYIHGTACGVSLSAWGTWSGELPTSGELCDDCLAAIETLEVDHP